MIGNDIVDLRYANEQSNCQRKGFLNKIFTKSEQQSIFKSEDYFKTIWLLWSMKESAYKIYMQQNALRFFNPKKFICTLKDNGNGTVRINNEKYHTQSQLTSDYIHTVAVRDKNSAKKICHFQLNNDEYQTQHVETTKQLLLEISKYENTPICRLEIMKDEVGIPRVYYENSKLNYAISISHHGKYGAYAILN